MIGGGITGAGVALDAASRGLQYGAVERHDFASGTSSKSSKLVHGGLRYLQQRDFRLVYEALHERQILLENAPHLVVPAPLPDPAVRSRRRGQQGRLADLLDRALDVRPHRRLRIGKRHERIGARRGSRPSADAQGRQARRRVHLLRRTNRRCPLDAHGRADRRARPRRRARQLRGGDRTDSPTGRSRRGARVRAWAPTSPGAAIPTRTSTRPTGDRGQSPRRDERDRRLG